MSIEAFDRARQIFTRLNSSEDFCHGGEDSKGIRVQADSLLKGIAGLAITYPPDVKLPLILMGRLIKTVSKDYGAYVRIIDGSDNINVNVRGYHGSKSPELMTREELTASWMRRSGVEIVVNSNGKSGIYADTAYLVTPDGRAVEDVINSHLDRLTREQREELADNFINIVAREVAISGEFLDL